ncbi:TIR domain-containing protein [Oligosphaera ethanolica]|uniref:WD40 repeat protein n=1 Tax=Oligosphaera ethanolica TaxID=760260 RepID=A0AAE4APQ6_9BACT|nr:TIR domain-containing protein [Oligosphaera ethanolica]MDQ0291579.1 WD40 repeat protein [Oligosphaera ethanolica]
MNDEESRNAVLALLRRQGKVRNSEVLALLGGRQDLFGKIREDLLFEELAEDVHGLGLRYTGPAATPATGAGPVRLFLSYGRRDAADLAQRLEKDLKDKGYKVWRDIRKIKPGTDFGAEILDGLRSAQIVIALMTPHSTRTTRDADSPDSVDSVCLGELAYALFNPPPHPVVPVMAQTCEPPLSIFHLDYVDLRRWQDSEDQYQAGLQRLIDGIEAARRGEKRYRSWHHLLAPFDFAGFLHAKRDRFTGRQWLFDKIDAWRQAGQGRALLIKGDPGTGKSAVVAELVHRNPGGQVLAYHCCQWDVGDTLEPWRFVRSIAAMLASKSEDYAALLADPAIRDTLSEESCRRDPESAFERGVLDPLQRLHAPESSTRYLLVDALDEALGLPEGEKTIVQLLASRLDRLPPWLRIVATTRKDPRVLDKLQGLRAEEIEAQSEDNLADLKVFIRAELGSPDFAGQARASGLPPETLVAQLVDKSGGNFLYVRQALEAIRTQDASFAGLRDLPPGLSGLYALRFGSLFPTEASFEPLIPLLEAICAAREPVGRAVLAAVAGLDDERAVERRLVRMAGYLARRSDAQGRPLFAVYHKSFAEWLTDPEREVQLHWVSVAKGNHRFAEWCLSEYRRGPLKMNNYALRHVVGHLLADKRWDDLIGDEATPGPLTDLLFIQAKCEAGLVHDLMTDYNAALAALPEFREENERNRQRDAAMAAYHQALREYAVARCDWWFAKERGETRPEPPYPPLPEALREQIEGAIPEDSSPRAARLRHFANFVSGNLALLSQSGQDTLPLAYNWADSGPVSAQAENQIATTTEPCLRRSPRPPAPLRPQCLRTLEGHSGEVLSVSFSPDGRRAVSGSNDQTVRVWDLETGACLRTLEGHSGWVGSVSVSLDGRRAVSGSVDKTVRVWDLETGACLRTLEGHTEQVASVSVSLDGRRAVSGSWDETVRVWDLETGACLLTLEGHTEPVASVSVSPDGRRAVSGSWDETVRVWDLETGACLRTLEGHTEQVASVSVSLDGRRAVSGSWDETVRVWDLETGACLRTLEGHTEQVASVSVSLDGRRAVSGSRDHTVRVWDLETGACLRTLEGHTDQVWSVSFSPDGRRAVSGSFDKTLRVWDLETGACLRTLEGHSSGVKSMSVSLDGRRAVSGSVDKTVRVWDLETGACLRTLEGHTEQVASVSVSPDGRRAVSGSRDHTVRVWDLETGACLRTLEGHTDEVLSVSFSPDGRHAVSGSWDDTVRVWDLETGACLRTLEGHSVGVSSVSVSPDGRRAVSGSGDQTVRVWDLETGQCLRTLEGHADWVLSVSVSPDGRRAVSGSFDKTVRVWDLETGQCLAVYQAGASVSSVAFSPDGERIICGTKDGQMHFLTPVNFPPSGPPLITAVRLWRFGEATKQPDGTVLSAPGRWDDHLTCRCLHCGKLFEPTEPVVEIGREGAQDIRKGLWLPASAYANPRLLAPCPHCGGALKYNPFVVDSG